MGIRNRHVAHRFEVGRFGSRRPPAVGKASVKYKGMVTLSLIVLVGFHQSGDSVLRSGRRTMLPLKCLVSSETLTQVSGALDKVILLDTHTLLAQ